jgi:hypothetical protein
VIPQTILDQLQRHFHVNAFHNLFLTRELHQIYKLFAAQGIPVIPFKGPTLAAMAYGDLSLRQFGDLDILIDKKDLLKAKELLISQGYQLKLTDAQEAAHLQSHYHLHFVRADGRVIVEVHWALTGKHWPFPFDFERSHAHLVPVSCGDATLPSFLPEDLLVFLCVHGSRHQWERLMWLCDIAELIRTHPQMEWQRLLARAETSGSKRMLLLGLSLANDLLGTDLPEDILQSVQQDTKVKMLAGQVQTQLSVHPTGLPRLADWSAFRIHVFLVKVRERFRDKIQYFLHYPFRMHIAHMLLLLAVTTADEKAQTASRLPPFLSSFYYRRLRPIQRVVQYELWQVKALLKPS